MFSKRTNHARRQTGAIVLACLLGATLMGARSHTLSGPSSYEPQELACGILNIPIAGADDAQALKTAKSRGAKINLDFFTKYHTPVVAAVRELTRRQGLGLGHQISLFGWMVVKTHQKNRIGYLWGGDLRDNPRESWSTPGVGYDCSGYFWSVWEAIEPRGVFANKGVRIAARDYLKLGRQVFPRSKVDETFIANLRELARPGDAIIDPNGHICLVGYDPRSNDGALIVLENGEYWKTLDKWFSSNRGKKLEVRSCFTEDGQLIVTDRRVEPRRDLAPLDLLVASASEAMEKQKSPAEKETKDAPTPARKLENKAPAAPKPEPPNHAPTLVAVRAPSIQQDPDAIQFTFIAEDPDQDSIVEFRLREYGTDRWMVSNSPHVRTSAPGREGELLLEFQVIDEHGKASAPTCRKVLLSSS